jgi:Ca2+-transporting ATPase
LKSSIHSLNYVKKINIPEHIIGLTDEKLKPQGKVWSERTNSQTNAQMVVSSFDLFKEPMLLLLIAVAVIYFVSKITKPTHAGRIVVVSEFLLSGQPQSDCDGSFRKLNEPLSTVLRNGEPVRIATAAIVIDDLVIAEEGNTINADGEIVHSNDFSVNESLLTGEPYMLSSQKNRSQVHLVVH